MSDASNADNGSAWMFVILLLFLIVAVPLACASSLTQAEDQRDECESTGGTYVRTGGRSVMAQCVKDGKITIIWNGSQRTDSP